MAKNKPVKIWVARHKPSKDPKFHQAEIFEGAGRSTRAPFAIFRRGWVLRRLAIKKFL